MPAHRSSRPSLSGKPATSATTQVDGAAAFFQTSGNPELQPRTVVFVHSSGRDSRLWRLQMPVLAASGYCIAPDLPGHGRSEGLGFDQVQEYAGWLGRFLAALAIAQPVVLVGHGLGGMVAQAFALANPRSVAGLVLAGTAALWRCEPELLASLARGEVPPSSVQMLFAAGADPALVQEEVRQWGAASPEVRFGDIMAAQRFDNRRGAAKLRVPTLVLCGESDRTAPPELAYFLHEQIAGSQLRLLSGASHMAMLEQPQAFNEYLKTFLFRL